MNDRVLCLKHHDELYLIDLSITLYFMADDHYTYVLYSTGTNFLIPFGLNKVEDLLVGKNIKSFKRTGRKYIINTDFVHSASTSKLQLTMATATDKLVRVHLSRQALRELINCLSGLV